jgi:hypothetical protein
VDESEKTQLGTLMAIRDTRRQSGDGKRSSERYCRSETEDTRLIEEDVARNVDAETVKARGETWMGNVARDADTETREHSSG